MDVFWKKVQRTCIALAVVIPSTAELAIYTEFLPAGVIPDWVKTLVGGMIMLGVLIPKFTVHENLKDQVK